MDLNIKVHGANLAYERRNAFACSPTMRQTLPGLANQVSLPGLLEMIMDVNQWAPPHMIILTMLLNLIWMMRKITLMASMTMIIHQTRQVLDLHMNRTLIIHQIQVLDLHLDLVASIALDHLTLQLHPLPHKLSRP